MKIHISLYGENHDAGKHVLFGLHYGAAASFPETNPEQSDTDGAAPAVVRPCHWRPSCCTHRTAWNSVRRRFCRRHPAFHRADRDGDWGPLVRRHTGAGLGIARCDQDLYPAGECPGQYHVGAALYFCI